ncbi:hypothetical protein [Pseudomonas putida]|uniref:DUF4234 domain-containing protein n=1 Tax=Pseudomonas putida TaxID=303 RepID=A0A1Q9R0Z9_PSEPU|nr:hypothetical protein [Pseudomonas putida]OLS61081.1 hypothetical protein PSEMO_40600 [Pseudomonas putida]
MTTNPIPAASEAPQSATPMFYVVSINKLIALLLVTSNLYAFYWFYRNWSAYRQATGEALVPLLRSIIPVLFMYPLLSRVERGLNATGRRFDWSPLMLTLVMWLVIVASLVSPWLSPEPSELTPPKLSHWGRLLFETFLYFAITTWLFCRVQRAINTHEGDLQGQANSQITWANWIWIAVGVLMWTLYVAVMTVSMSVSFLWGLS